MSDNTDRRQPGSRERTESPPDFELQQWEGWQENPSSGTHQPHQNHEPLDVNLPLDNSDNLETAQFQINIRLPSHLRPFQNSDSGQFPANPTVVRIDINENSEIRARISEQEAARDSTRIISNMLLDPRPETDGTTVPNTPLQETAVPEDSAQVTTPAEEITQEDEYQERTCAICMEAFTSHSILKPCKHAFDSDFDCVDSWLYQQYELVGRVPNKPRNLLLNTFKCPMCRRRIESIQISCDDCQYGHGVCREELFRKYERVMCGGGCVEFRTG